MKRAPMLVVLGLALGVLAGCAYHAGDEAARDFDGWVADHPLVGAKVTDRTGTNVQPFRGTFQADAELTATPSEGAIVAAMASMCRFDAETTTRTRYWLYVDKLWLQAPCRKDRQQKVAGFWSDVHGLAGIEEVDFSPRGLAVTATDAEITGLVPKISAAADRSGWAEPNTANVYRSPRVSITQPKDANVSDQLALVQGVLDAAGSALVSVTASPGLVTASTSGSVEQARGWQADVGNGSQELLVMPTKITTEVAVEPAARPVLERLATDDRVMSVAIIKGQWSIRIPSTEQARALLPTLGDSHGVGLGRLTLDIGKVPRDSGKGIGRTCDIRPVPGGTDRAEALLDLCDLLGMVEVDDRFDTLGLRIEDQDYRGMIVCLHRLAVGQKVYLTTKDNSSIEFTIGSTLETQYPNSPLGKVLIPIWNAQD
ncbi:hypothetical protein [Nocardioides marmorisolisilvae]|uniref:GerMN domain-containing protein n=1 Tax=Nocardioides marmorisolisilvae TaxID=1542737 RepID=A0A3N0DZH8_9ACTN|nr:hypothetical protein [Nocardioides marmorisolisilvae]RNL80906.1 hypothetical protein EFL95_00510 [Nocardioides marmorisolisilvae]